MFSIDSQRICQQDPRFWNGKFDILQACITHIDQHAQINQEALDKIIDELKGTFKKLPVVKLKRLEKVLSRLNEMGLVEAVLPAIPEHIPRASFLPVNIEELEKLDAAECLMDFIWDEWLSGSLMPKGQITSSKYIHESLALAFACMCIGNGAIGSRVIFNLMVSMIPNDIQDNGTIRARIYPRQDVRQYAYLSIPSTARLILIAIRSKQRNKRLNKPVFFSSTEGTELRRKLIKIKLKKSYESLKKEFVDKTGNTNTPDSWAQFTKLLQLVPILDGLEPYIASVMYNYPLPPSHPEKSKYKLEISNSKTSPPIGLITTKLSSIKLPKSGIEVPDLSAEEKKSSKEFPIDFCGSSKNILRQVIYKVKEITNEEATGSQKKIHQAIDEIDRQILAADKIAPNTSALHLALLWIRDFINKHQKVTPSTIETYLSRGFLNGLLCDPDSIDLAAWDEEDHELAAEEIISRESIRSANSRKNIATIYSLIYQFASDHQFCCIVNLSSITNEWTGGSSRHELIGISEFDTFIYLLLEKGDRDSEQLAVACILAFYGGLRAGEVSRLTLNDVVVCDDHLYIDIHKGKTTSARREIPLHLLAQNQMLKIVSMFAEHRRSEFPANAHLHRISLFGPYKCRDRYAKRTIANAVNKLLKQSFGSSISMHHLRHAFGSWTLLRMYACRYPDIVKSLSESTHEVFSQVYLNRINYLMTGTLENRMSDDTGTGLVRLSKLIGHLGPRTMFSTYVHTFHLIQAHAMNRMSEIYGQRTLNGKTIAAIVPKMKTRHSQARIKDKSINGVLAHLLNTHTK